MSRETIIWLGLVLATIVSTYSAEGGHLSRSAATVFVFVIAFAKVRFVMFEFMDLRNAPFVMRIVSNAWLVGACLLLVSMFLFGTLPFLAQ